MQYSLGRSFTAWVPCATSFLTQRALSAPAEESNTSSDTKLGPTALRPFVWQHLFKEGKDEAMPRTEAFAYAAAVCDKHVLPFWPCGCMRSS